MAIIEAAGATDIGRKRKGNEDALFLDVAGRLFIVADGMGGHQAGEVASRLVVDTMSDYMIQFRDNRPAADWAVVDQTLSKEANRLLSSIHIANRHVNRISHTQDAYRGMGSTVSAVLFTDETLIAANVGDSPIYLVQKGAIERLSVPHTVLAEQAAIDPGRAAILGSQFRHVLTRAVGIEGTLEPDICEIPFFKDDIIIVSSDGLSEKVSPDEILRIVDSHGPDAACRRLIALANQRGGDDNVTVIVAKVKEASREKGSYSTLPSGI